MVKKKLLLMFPPQLVETPVTYHLIHDYGLVINILKANVTPGKKGRLVVAAEGEKAAMNKAMEYLVHLGVEVKPVAEAVNWKEDRCVHCTACVPICPAECFVVERQSMKVSFKRERCMVCRLCLSACPYGAVEVLLEGA